MGLDAFLAVTYDSYEKASERSFGQLTAPPPPPIHLYSWITIPRLLMAALLILLHSLYPYLLLALGIVTLLHQALIIPVMLLMVTVLLVVWRTHSNKLSKPGLFFFPSERNNEIIRGCSLLQAEHRLPGSITQKFSFCPWMFSGDLRTLFPYLANRPAPQSYQRRWVRVPLAAGPYERLQHSDDGGEFEAVAVDYKLHGGSSKNLLILAGLSGGSNEGYCLDLVDYASRQGWNCFVMLGRGLADPELPCLSDALFHGARVSDAAATARIIKESFEGEVMMVGISLGGIIAANGLSRDAFGDCVAAGVAISSCCENAGNMSFKHSREVWQPILAHGLKIVFATHPILLSKLRRVLGSKYADIIPSIRDIVEFDSIVVTALNGFEDVLHYYSNLSPVIDPHHTQLRKPLLMLHAMDDPITHVDRIPSSVLRSRSSLSEHLFTLITAVGGHVGWPLGWCPWRRRWEFQNRVALEFLESVYTLRHNSK